MLYFDDARGALLNRMQRIAANIGLAPEVGMQSAGILCVPLIDTRANMSRGIHHSYWIQQRPLEARFDALANKVKTDVLVVGGGITGLTTALELARRGKRVVVCEASFIGAGTTSGSTGHLDPHPETGTTALIKKLGIEDARAYTDARREAIRRIGEIAAGQCDWTAVKAYQYSELDKDAANLREEMEAAIRLGLRTAWVDTVPIPKARLGFELQDCARIDIGHYLQQLTQAVVQAGVKIYENTLIKVDGKENLHSLEGASGEVEFEHVVVATHSNFTPLLRTYAATPPYQSYVLTARVGSPLPDALFWDSSDPYFYVRRVNSVETRLIMVGGCDHRTGAGNETEAAERLVQWVRERFDVSEITAQWSAELFEPTDGLPMIGKAYGENMWVATGLSGIGLTQGTMAASMIAKLIDGHEVQLAERFSPQRSGMGEPVHWIREQVVSGADLAERVLPAPAVNPNELMRGEGAVGKLDGKHVAICRDQKGCLHQHSPICTHMGGVVHWNPVEQTWDCPFHGGRFAADGTRIYGPPQDNLSAVDPNN